MKTTVLSAFLVLAFSVPLHAHRILLPFGPPVQVPVQAPAQVQVQPFRVFYATPFRNMVFGCYRSVVMPQLAYDPQRSMPHQKGQQHYQQPQHIRPSGSS